MAWQYGVAQVVPLVTYSGGVPTAPTNPVATLSKDGAGFGATTNAVVHVADGACYVELTAAEMEMAAGHLRVTSDNCDPAVVPITTEADWTVLRAARIDTTIGSRSSHSAADVQEAIAAVHGSGRYDHASAIAVQVTQERVISDPADLLLIRGDTPQEVTFVFTDAETGEPIDPTAWDDWYLTIKPISARDADDDADAVAEVAGSAGDAGSGAVTFSFPADLEMERDREYDYDVEARTDAGAVRTFRVGIARLTHDVRRGSA